MLMTLHYQLFYVHMHENMQTGINMELSRITDWLIVNKLSLNIPKTNYTLFH